MFKIYEVSDFSDLQFLEKIQKLIHRLPKCFANCEQLIRTLTSNGEVCSIKCVTNPQHNTPDKNLYCYNNANITIYHKYSEASQK